MHLIMEGMIGPVEQEIARPRDRIFRGIFPCGIPIKGVAGITPTIEKGQGYRGTPCWECPEMLRPHPALVEEIPHHAPGSVIPEPPDEPHGKMASAKVDRRIQHGPARAEGRKAIGSMDDIQQGFASGPDHDEMYDDYGK